MSTSTRERSNDNHRQPFPRRALPGRLHGQTAASGNGNPARALCLLGHHYLVDDVDDAIIRNDIGLHDIGVVHSDLAAFHGD